MSDLIDERPGRSLSALLLLCTVLPENCYNTGVGLIGRGAFHEVIGRFRFLPVQARTCGVWLGSRSRWAMATATVGRARPRQPLPGLASPLTAIPAPALNITGPASAGPTLFLTYIPTQPIYSSLYLPCCPPVRRAPPLCPPSSPRPPEHNNKPNKRSLTPLVAPLLLVSSSHEPFATSP